MPALYIARPETSLPAVWMQKLKCARPYRARTYGSKKSFSAIFGNDLLLSWNNPLSMELFVFLLTAAVLYRLSPQASANANESGISFFAA